MLHTKDNSKAWFKKNETAYGKVGITSNTPFNQLLWDESDDNLKQLINYYDMLGRNQVMGKKEQIKKLRDLANGVINVSDFVKEDELKELQSIDANINFREDDLDLEFFPIVPPIVNRLTGEFDKKYLRFNVRAVNPEATNEIIEKRNQDLMQMLQQYYEKSLGGADANKEEFQQKVQEKMAEYAKNYRTEIEEWCVHFMNVAEQQFNLRSLERDIFRENLIHEEPFVHINYQNNHFYPEIWKPEDVFYVKSKTAKDASDYTMIGKYSFIDFSSVLQKYSLDEDQVKQLSKWTEYYNGASGFIQNGQYQFNGTNTKIQESRQNYLTAKTLMQGDTYVGQNRLVRETYMYFLVPKKVGLLTAITSEGSYTVEVDSTFKVTIKPEYTHKEKKKEFLKSGEHVEWTYINVIYQCVKLDMTFGSTYFDNSSNSDFEPIYVKLGKHDIQYQHKNLRYGTRLPVHGGAIMEWSVVSKTAPWQKFYNYLWNRNKQLLATEIGKFLLLNQNILPQNSTDGSWQEHSLLKAFLTAKDISLMPTDLSLTNVGQLQAGAGMGQVIDLNKTQEVIEKAQLASMIKMECYDSLGLNPTFMAHTSPYQSAKSVSQGLDQTVTQLQYLYSKHYDIMKNVWATMLETGLYLTSKGELRNFSYTNSDGQRIIFNLMEENPLLTELNIYPENDPNDIMDLETVKQIIISNNTLGLDALGITDMVFAKSPNEVRVKLKEGILKHDKEIAAQREHEKQLQQEQIKAQQDAVNAKMKNDNMNSALDREGKLEYARIDALKFAKTDVDTMAEEIKQMSEYNLEMAKHEEAKNQFNVKFKIEEMKANNMYNLSQNQLDINEKLKIKEIELRQRELEETAKRNAIMANQKNKEK